MKKVVTILVTGALLGSTCCGRADDDAMGKTVEFAVYNGYFEKNNSGLKGDSSYLAVTDSKTFEKVFGIARVLGNKQAFLPKDPFDKLLVVAVLKRGDALVQYKLEKVTADDKTLTVTYTTKPGASSGAKFSSPLILSVDKEKYMTVQFVENGKNVEKVEISK